MRPQGRRNNGFSVVSGGLARRELSPEEHFEREFRSWTARGKVTGLRRGGERYATRALKDTAEGLRFPNRIPARVLGEALQEGASVAWALELPDVVRRYVIRKARALGLNVDAFDKAA